MLASWALPKGIPPDPRQNRLAVRTEDHPLEYLEFSGEIPRGEYGGGRWDLGRGHVRRGEVPRRRGDRRAPRRARHRPLRAVPDRRQELDDPPDGPAGGPGPGAAAGRDHPDAGEASALPANTDDWAFEIKWDGVRALAYVQGGRVRLHGRSGLDMTATYPEVRGARRRAGHGRVHARRRAGRVRRARACRASSGSSSGSTSPARAGSRGVAQSVPVTYHVFDLLFLEGHSTMSLPTPTAAACSRRSARRPLVGDAGLPRRLRPRDARLHPRSTGMEGVIGEAPRQPYEPGRRSGAWMKVKNVAAHPARDRRLHARQGRPHRPHRRASCWASGRPTGTLRCAGKAGSGLTWRADRRARGRCSSRARTSPFDSGTVPAGTTFVEPVHRAEIEFTEWTASRTLRHPTFKALVAGRRGLSHGTSGDLERRALLRARQRAREAVSGDAVRRTCGSTSCTPRTARGSGRSACRPSTARRCPRGDREGLRDLARTPT